jgi:AraC-like DNA-binding protein
MSNTCLLPACYKNAPVVEPKELPAIRFFSEVNGEKMALWYGIPEPHRVHEHRHDIHQLTILPGADTECAISWRTADNKRKVRHLEGSQIIYIGKHVPHLISMHAKFPVIHLYLGDSFVEKYAPEYLLHGITIKKWWDAVRADLHVWFTTSFIIDSYEPVKNPETSFGELGPQRLKMQGVGNLALAAMFLASNLLMLDKVYSRQSTSRSLSSFQLRKVIDFIHENFRKPLVVEDLAGVVGLGKDRFAHLFKAVTGCTPHCYLMAVKLNHAQQLLRSGKNLTLAQVAVEAGFCDQSHFRRCLQSFCEKHAKFPREYTI